MTTRLYVGNLAYGTTKETLRAAFAEDGRNVVDATIVSDRVTGQSRGFGFVEMGSPEDAQKAIEACDGRDVDGRALRVNHAQEREQRGGGGGGGGRRGGGGGGGGGYGDRRPQGGDRGNDRGNDRGGNRNPRRRDDEGY